MFLTCSYIFKLLCAWMYHTLIPGGSAHYSTHFNVDYFGAYGRLVSTDIGNTSQLE